MARKTINKHVNKASIGSLIAAILGIALPTIFVGITKPAILLTTIFSAALIACLMMVNTNQVVPPNV